MMVLPGERLASEDSEDAGERGPRAQNEGFGRLRRASMRAADLDEGLPLDVLEEERPLVVGGELGERVSISEIARAISASRPKRSFRISSRRRARIRSSALFRAMPQIQV